MTLPASCASFVLIFEAIGPTHAGMTGIGVVMPMVERSILSAPIGAKSGNLISGSTVSGIEYSTGEYVDAFELSTLSTKSTKLILATLAVSWIL